MSDHGLPAARRKSDAWPRITRTWGRPRLLLTHAIEDTIEIHGRRIRLHGIDAPESDQLCTIGGSNYRCGQRAALALADFIGQRTVSCEQRDTDRYDRAVAVCSAGNQDLGAWLVGSGHALAYRRYSTAYVTEEAAAAAAHRGIWAGDFDAPWDWRRR